MKAFEKFKRQKIIENYLSIQIPESAFGSIDDELDFGSIYEFLIVIGFSS